MLRLRSRRSCLDSVPSEASGRPLYGLGVTPAKIKILSIGQGPLATPAEVMSHHQGEACDCKNIA